MNCCPQDNYEVFASLVKFVKEKHLPSKIESIIKENM